MRGQVSAEYLIVMAVAFSALALVVPNVQKALDAGNGLLNARAASVILDAANYACEAALITGRGSARIHAPTDYALESRGGKLIIAFGNRTLERESECIVGDGRVSRGTGMLLAENRGGKALLRPEPQL